MRKKLLAQIVEALEDNNEDLNKNVVKVRGRVYGVSKPTGEWRDDGKLQWIDERGILCRYDKVFNSVIVKEYSDIIIGQEVSRTNAYCDKDEYFYEGITVYRPSG